MSLQVPSPCSDQEQEVVLEEGTQTHFTADFPMHIQIHCLPLLCHQPFASGSLRNTSVRACAATNGFTYRVPVPQLGRHHSRYLISAEGSPTFIMMWWLLLHNLHTPERLTLSGAVVNHTLQGP